jgi:hypothetical protein
VTLRPTRKLANLDSLKRGDIVIADFPFEDAKTDDDFKERRAVILGRSDARSFACCMVTKNSGAKDSIPLGNSDLSSGRLAYDPSFIRPNKIQTLSYSNIDENQGKIGSLKEETLKKVMETAMKVLTEEVSLSAMSSTFARPQKRIR